MSRLGGIFVVGSWRGLWYFFYFLLVGFLGYYGRGKIFVRGFVGSWEVILELSFVFTIYYRGVL